MYRPRALKPSDAEVHFARNADGTIPEHHNELCFAHEDSVRWGVEWGTKLLRTFPFIDKVILYNLRTPCLCESCRDGGGIKYAAEFLERCRSEWKKVRPKIEIGHVGIGMEYSEQVDFFCPFLCVNRDGESPVDIQHQVAKVTALKSQSGNKAVIPLAKICWASSTNNSTDDIIGTIRGCEKARTGFILWYYDWVFHATDGRYNPKAILTAMGGNWQKVSRYFSEMRVASKAGKKESRNDPQSWVYFESKESGEGLRPRLELYFDKKEQHIPAFKDAVLISYLANSRYGLRPPHRLSISMNDTNRALVFFPLPRLPEGASLKKARVLLDMKLSKMPPVEAFDLAVHTVTDEWYEQDVCWNNQPTYSAASALTVTVKPEPGTVIVDVTEIAKQWLAGTVPNNGILLKVAHVTRPTEKKSEVIPRNDPKSWIYFESKESPEGQAPRMFLSLTTGGQEIPVFKDSLLISYLAARAWGGHPQLSISMGDTNRVLLAFSLPRIPKSARLEKAEIVLDMKLSMSPPVVPFELAVHTVTSEWDEQNTCWDNQPTYSATPGLTVRIWPEPGTVRIDVTEMVKQWVAGTTPNNGILLKVAHIAPPMAKTKETTALAAESADVADLTFPHEEKKLEKLPWPHQGPDLSSEEIKKLNEEVWVINDSPLYQADQHGNWRYFHGGLDIVLDNGTKIYAMKDGWVKAIRESTIAIADAKSDEPSYGWEYCHLANFQLKVGAFVKKGTLIGEIKFKGLPHIHLNRVFSEGNYWGIWSYICYPNGHFTYIDEEPPVIKKPFYFFKNSSDTMIQPNASGDLLLSGDVDIVVGMREAGLYARSKENNFGDRLGVTRVDYEICPVSKATASKHQFHSFDFRKIKIKKAYDDKEYSTAVAKVVYKHWTLFETTRPSGDKIFNYYIISNCSGQESPTELKFSDREYCWSTGALHEKGQPIFPDGKYDITVTASDFAGNTSTQTMRVTVENRTSK